MPASHRNLLALSLAATGCSASLEGPAPTLTGTAPALVCNQQLETEVVVSGSNLAPMVRDALSGSQVDLPALTLTRAGDPTGADDGESQIVALDELDAASVRWIDDATMAFTIREELAVSDGLFDLSVESGAGDTAELAASLTSVPPPTLDGLAPQLVCTEQYDNALAVEGTGILVVEGELPSLVVGDAVLPFESVDGCEDLAGPTEARWCTTGETTLPQGALDVGIFDASIANPEPATCASVEAVAVQVVAPPTVELVDPELTCVSQGEQELVVTGTGFLVVGGVLPTVTYGDHEAQAEQADGCTPLAGPVEGEACTELRLTLPQDAVEPGVFDVSVENPDPAGCVSTEPVQAEVVPAPVLLTAEPLLECTEQSDQQLLLTGEGFVVLDDGTLPLVTVGDYTASADNADSCTDLAGPAGGQRCTELTFTLPTGVVPEGVADVRVTNPEAFGCESLEAVEIELIGAPELAQVDPQPVCVADQDRDLTLQGTGFLFRADGSLPAITVGTGEASVTGGDVCTSLLGPEGGELCEILTATLPTGAVEGGLQDVTVTNPETAECASLESVQLEVFDAPGLTSLAPEGACSSTDPFVDVVLTGTDFLIIDGVQPTVTVAGDPVTIDEISGCTDTTSGDRSCTTMAFTVPAGALGDGEHEIAVTNPGTADCTSTDYLPFVVTEPPTVTSIVPTEVCEGGESVTVIGEGFVSTTSVTIGTEEAVVTYVSSTELQVEIPPEIDPGTYDMLVENIEGCFTTVEDAVTVLGAPTVFYVDPPVVYSGVTFQATVYVTGIDDGVASVWMESADTGDRTELEFTVDSLSRISAVIPAGFDDGSYHVGVEDEDACTDQLDDAVEVTSELTVSVDAVDPPFGSTLERAAVEISSADPTPEDLVSFEDVPRVYLNPAEASTETAATALSSVSWETEFLLDAIVPASLDAGSYDVLVINPSGDIGLLEDGFTVTDQNLPIIDGVSPSSLVNSDDEDVTITGESFDVDTVEVMCEAPDGTASTDSATVLSSSSTSIDATVPSSLYDTGTVCVVRVTNSDGTWADYASVAITNSSGNIDGWTDGTELTTARRAPAVAAGRATATARYVYAIGGDDGDASGAMASIERARLGQYGDLGEWEALGDSLPAARTLAAMIRVDEYLYLLGGHDGDTAVDTAWRARVLDPNDAPQVDDIAIDYADADGLGEGTWIYRVAATFAADDSSNPGGMSLAGDPFVVRLPETSGGIELTLEWSEVDGADGYRIFRTPAAEAGSGSEEWLADVSGGGTTSYTDTGDDTDSSVVPLPKGALGQWAELSAMSTAREGACVTAGVDPDDPATWYVFVAGGLDASGNALDSIEYLDVTIESDDRQTAGSWATSAESLSSARWDCGAFSVTEDLHTVVSGAETWLYFGGGYTDAGESGETDAGQVAAGGDLTGFTAVDAMDDRAGYGVGSAGDYLYVFGGSKSDTAADDGRSAQICGDSTDPGCAASPADPPDLRNWNALGVTMAEDRYLLGSAQESGVLIVVGGQTASEDATATTETTNF